MKINGKPDGGGGGGVITGLSISANGIYIAEGGVDGYSPVEVSVPEQKPEETFNVTPSTTEQTITPQEGYVFTSGVVGAVTSNIDANIQAGNIKSGVTILGVEGNYTAPAPVTESLSVSINGTYTPGTGVDGFSQVVVDVPVTGWTDKDITEVKVNIVNLNNDASYVGSYAFEEHQTLQTVNLPSCQSVYHNAFDNCNHLTEVSLPICSIVSSSAFTFCTRLQSIELPECTVVGQNAFYGCYSLSYASFNKCSIISGNAFMYCSSLYSVYLLSNSVTFLNDRYVFSYTPISNGIGNIYVPYSLVSSYRAAQNWSLYNNILPYFEEFEFINGLVVGSASTMDSTYLEVLSISTDEVISVSMYNVNSLESSTFMNYPNLVSVSFPKVTYYGDDTFAGCTSLSEVDINQSSLGDRVFAGCTSLETVNVAYNGLVTIGSDVFSGCTGLTSIYVLADYYSDYVSAQNWSEYSSLIVGVMPELAFNNGLVYGSISMINNTYTNTLGITSTQVTAVSLPNCLSVSVNTFYSCGNLLTVDIPECTYVGESCFAECKSLRSINLAKCEYIDNRAFQGAFQSNGTNINLDLPVCSYIGASAFYWVQRLSAITLRSNSVCVLNNSTVFDQANLGSIYVPASLVDAYKSAQWWSNFASKIKAIPEP